MDESGASTYALAIYSPPGTAGVAPQVAFSYSSRNPTGPMGPGWALSGLSSIGRCKATIESGDVGALADVAINFDDDASNDAYCLDGQRLYPVGTGLGSGVLACPGVGGATGQQFAPELDTATRVCGYTASAGALGFSMWLVQGRDGSIRRYGATRQLLLRCPTSGIHALATMRASRRWMVPALCCQGRGQVYVLPFAREGLGLGLDCQARVLSMW